jgi:hypothetical protein
MKMLIQIIDEDNDMFLELRNDNGSVVVDGFGFFGGNGAAQVLEAAAHGIPVVLNATAKQLRNENDTEV